MSFPTVQTADTKNGTVTTNSSSWTMTYPTNLASGDLILAFAAVDGSTASPTWPSGFVAGFSVATSAIAFHVAKKVSDGTETGNFTFNPGGSEQGGWRVFRITGWGGTLGTSFPNGATSGDVCAAISAETVSSSPNPPSLDPNNWATEDTLWIAACAVDTSRTIGAYPLANLNTSDNSGGAGGATLGLCTMNDAVSSKDPGTFSASASDDWVAATIAVRPSSAAGNTTLTAGAGTFSYSGGNATAVYNKILNPAAGTFAYSGGNAQALKGVVSQASAGVFSYSGGDANIKRDYVSQAGAGNFTYGGGDAEALRGLLLLPNAGVFLYDGGVATILKGYGLLPNAGSFSYSGGDATIKRDWVSQAGAGSFAYSGGDATARRTYILTALAGTFSYDGGNATAIYTPTGAYTLTADSGVFSYSGGNAQALKATLLQPNAGSFAYDGGVANAVRAYLLQPATGVFAYDGGNAVAVRAYLVTPGAGVFAYAGGDASLIKATFLTPQAGVFIYNGGAANAIFEGLVTAGPVVLNDRHHNVAMCFMPILIELKDYQQ